MTSKATQDIDRALRAAEREAEMARLARGDRYRAIEFMLKPQDTKAGSVLSLRDDFGRILEGYAKLRDACKTYKRIVVKAAPKLGKSTILTYGDTICDIGEDPENSRTIIGSATKVNAIKHVMYIRTQIESNARIRMVYPKLAQGELWQQDQFRVAGSQQAQPTVQAIGDLAHIQGFRAWKHKFDDMVDPTSALSRYLCEQQAEWIMDIEDRVDPDGWRQMIQNPHRVHDTGNILVKKYGWYLYEMPAIDEAGKTLYPKIWPQKAVDDYAPARKNQHLRCIEPTDGDVIFEEPWLEKCRRLGVGLNLHHLVDSSSLPDGVFVVHGCDPAGAKPEEAKSGNDEWGLTSALCAPPEYFLERLTFAFEESREVLQTIATYNQGKSPDEQTRVLQLLNIQGGRWGITGGEERLIQAWTEFGGIIVAESNGVAQWLQELLRRRAPHIPVYAQATGANKHHEQFGVRASANDFAVGAWIIPSREVLNDEGKRTGRLESESETEQLLEDLRTYSPTVHTPDKVSSLWLARCGARLFAPQFHGVGTIDIGSQSGQGRAVQGNPLAEVHAMLAERAKRAGVDYKPKTGEENDVRERVRRRFF